MSLDCITFEFESNFQMHILYKKLSEITKFQAYSEIK